MAEFVQANHMLTVETGGKGFYEITSEVAQWLKAFGADAGLVTVFVCHTSASLTIQENADPNVRLDLLVALDALAPEDRAYAHQEEGPDGEESAQDRPSPGEERLDARRAFDQEGAAAGASRPPAPSSPT